MRFKGAIFDMDGLLFDTEAVYQETWQELAAEMGVKLAEHFPQSICGTSGEHMNRLLEEFYHVSDGNAVREECMKRVMQKLTVKVDVMKGAEEILQFFRENGVKLAVASSSSTEQIRANLEKVGFTKYFDAVVSGKDVKNGKPAPDIFLAAAEKIGCDPTACCIFEDSENGIRAGYRAGCAAIMIPDLVQPAQDVRDCCSGIYTDLLEAMEALRD